jgi:purine-binding chemotaxis protein CheW
MAISQAPNTSFELDDVPEYCKPFMVKGRSGYSFNQEIKDSIVFEYHDILHENPLPDLDIILARDVLSFLPAQDQARIVNGFGEKLKSRGIVILGRNESLSGDWQFVGKEPVSAFAHTE